ncbi:MAG: DUF924 domain-containing protein [Gammaproteobacteria bacterium]|nr:DUF924 domain-containing protein [Gammaproteobacteria bacterium]
MTQPHEILDFWFSERCRKCWFESTQEMDQEIRERFESVWRQARDGELDEWRQSAEGCLALAIILDQFPLNMYRNQPQSFSTEAMARDCAREAIENGFQEQLDESQQLFLFLPFMHSENLADQDTSVELFKQAGMETKWAQHHREIVKRFGRFPHRNAILGRQSTDEELEYMSSDEAFKG